MNTESYHLLMAIQHHSSDPIADEGRRLLEDDPQLAAEIDEFNRKLDAGEVGDSELHSSETVRRHLGLPPTSEPAPTD